MRTLARLLCLLVAIMVVDGHLLIGQSVAWFKMIHDRAPAMGLQEAVADTLSGDSPCEICLAIEDERERQRKEFPVKENSPSAKTVPLPCFGKRLTLYPPPAARPVHPRSAPRLASWQTDVPSPPPWLG